MGERFSRLAAVSDLGARDLWTPPGNRAARRSWWTAEPPEPRAGPVPVVVLVGILVVYAGLVPVLDGPAQTAVALAVTGVAAGVARVDGVGAAGVGLRRARLGRGLAWGLVVGGIAAGVVVVAALVPVGDDAFADDRYSGLSGAEVALEALARIPVLTALFEEFLFRGVLVGLLLRRLRPDRALALAAVLFGLWHVGPALGFADANAATPDAGGGTDALVVAGTVVATALGGAVLVWLRVRADSLVAPWLVHTAVNSTALVAAWATAA